MFKNTSSTQEEVTNKFIEEFYKESLGIEDKERELEKYKETITDLENRIRELEVDKKEQGASLSHKKVKDNPGQTKKNSSSRRRKSRKNLDTQHYSNGKITELSDCYNCDEMDVLDEEIFECIRDVGYVEKITEWSSIFLRMFYSDLTPLELSKKFGWQAVKKIVTGNDITDGEIIRENIKKYGGFFGKVIRVIKIKYILLYFNNENEIMNTFYKSGMEDEIGQGLQLKDSLTDLKILNDKIDDLFLVTELRKLMAMNQQVVLKETKDGDNINENKKHVAQIQGSRGDDDSKGSE
ncbi:hypothetical protein GLOIN_2v1771116 [Rhizophagus irregularis DAOM 181602=DAOM 197198]|uniref:Uncharacterized protein n=1 Tax=Rhizophagus irregularis (strain DAOM 181602 / DAOM 197198 / MUCL 43194) TaxID=747089 RepID=A0A2P4QAL6_RHIID|nr:hypothetical protein GLOIN_2v1771116 [Rhizophagus irregularis DAOM 181602=DAOM 197198]POG74679.1 hypothetical protein GLOIN_2v1771116 [Rhizophagus irregularis DAOM 181602=DAOM 197198]|eukprot:XP_025181545.1 hypothetical protein GLOIN_2v1771116 [Rhizophagus irregularis DAOM 181602=DAOM 197198]